MERAELDLSGGIDSAVMAAILVTALGPENVTLVHSQINTDPKATERARAMAKALKCPLAVIDLSGIFKSLSEKIYEALADPYWEAGWEERRRITVEMHERLMKDPTILGSLRSTLRAPVGRYANRLAGGGIRHGTGNECEDRFLRFYQKGGDGEVDTNPLEMLSKTEIYQLAFGTRRILGTDVKFALWPIIDAKPSPDLWGQGETTHTDEAELLSWTGVPFTYGRINSATGDIVKIGTIERVSRFLDQRISPVIIGDTRNEDVLFSARELSELEWEAVLTRAKGSKCFGGLDDVTVLNLLRAAKRVERITRHKSNANIPTLGNRRDLLMAGILTDELP
jgi:NH3-dependent NAD+ synthetase